MCVFFRRQFEKLSAVLFLFFISTAAAYSFDFTSQWTCADFADIDRAVLKTHEAGKTPEQVACNITKDYPSQLGKARAIFDWLAFNVAYDTSYRISAPDAVFEYRKGVCQGYAELFRKMASAVGLDCRVVSGASKSREYLPDGALGKHAWNVVMADNRAVIIDATWGAGYVSGGIFCKSFDDAWFDVDPSVAIFSHYPSVPEYQLLTPYVPYQIFFSLPFIDPTLSMLGFDGRAAIKYYREHESAWFPEVYSTLYDLAKDALKIKSLPLDKELTVGQKYDFQFVVPDGYTVKIANQIGSRSGDGSTTLSYCPDQTGIVVVSVLSGGKKVMPILKYRVRSAGSSVQDLIQSDGGLTIEINDKAVPKSVDAVRTDDGDSLFNMVCVKGGTVACDGREDPVSGFFVTRREITQREWSNVMVSNVPSYSGDFFSVDSISFNEAIKFCNAISKKEGVTPCYAENDGKISWMHNAGGYRLPTKAEWLRAASSETVLRKDIKVICWDAASDGAGTSRQLISLDKSDAEDGGLTETRGSSSEFSGNTYLYLVKSLPLSPADQYMIGCAYLEGSYLPIDMKQAFIWFSKAAAGDDPVSENIVGYLYSNNLGSAQDPDKAIEYFKMSATHGNMDAYNNLGNMYGYGNSRIRDPSNAVSNWSIAASMGHKYAQYELGLCFRDGIGVQKNPKESYEWFRKSALQEFREAAFSLGFCYETGFGTEKNYSEAMKWFEKSAAQGYDQAYLHLGICYFNALGVPRDYDKAVQMFNLALNAGSCGHSAVYSYTYKYFPSLLDSYSDGDAHGQIVVDSDKSEIKYRLAVCHAEGKGVSRDVAAARKLLIDSARSYEPAKAYLASMPK